MAGKYAWLKDRQKEERMQRESQLNGSRDMLSIMSGLPLSLRLAGIDEQSSGIGSQLAQISYTGTGENGTVEPDKPVEMMNTNEGPAMVHEGEIKIMMPDGSFKIIPAHELPPEFLQKLEVTPGTMKGFKNGGQGQLSLPELQGGLQETDRMVLPGRDVPFSGRGRYSPERVPQNFGNPPGQISQEVLQQIEQATNMQGFEEGTPGRARRDRTYGVPDPGTPSGAETPPPEPSTGGSGSSILSGIGNPETVYHLAPQTTTATGSVIHVTPREEDDPPVDLSGTPPPTTPKSAAPAPIEIGEAPTPAVEPPAEQPEQTPPTGLQSDIEYLRRIREGNDQFAQRIREGERGRFKGEESARMAALEQQMAQAGYTPREAMVERAMAQREIGAQEAQQMLSLYKMEGDRAFQAAITIPGLQARADELAFAQEKYGDTKQWDDFLHSAQYGDDAALNAAYKSVFGSDLDPAQIQDIRDFARGVQRTSNVEGRIGLLAANTPVSDILSDTALRQEIKRQYPDYTDQQIDDEIRLQYSNWLKANHSQFVQKSDQGINRVIEENGSVDEAILNTEVYNNTAWEEKMDPFDPANADDIKERIREKFEKLSEPLRDTITRSIMEEYPEFADTPGSMGLIRSALKLVGGDVSDDTVMPWDDPQYMFQFEDWNGINIEYDKKENRVNSTAQDPIKGYTYKDADGNEVAVTNAEATQMWDSLGPIGQSEYIDEFGEVDKEKFLKDKFPNVTGTQGKPEFYISITDLESDWLGDEDLQTEWTEFVTDPKIYGTTGEGEEASRFFYYQDGEKVDAAVDSDIARIVWQQLKSKFGDTVTPSTWAAVWNNGEGWVLDENGLIQNFKPSFQADNGIVPGETPASYRTAANIPGHILESGRLTTINDEHGTTYRGDLAVDSGLTKTILNNKEDYPQFFGETFSGKNDATDLNKLKLNTGKIINTPNGPVVLLGYRETTDGKLRIQVYNINNNTSSQEGWDYLY